jgi:GcrA cell cycle regulator
MSASGTTWQPWPSEPTEALCRLWALGESATMISRALDRLGYRYSRNAVIGKAHRSNLPPRSTINRTPRPSRAGGAPKVRGEPRHRGSTGGLAIKRRPKPKVQPVDLGPPEALMITTMQLTPHTCRYPLGEATGAAQLYCGAPKTIEISYCRFHYRLSYQPTRAFMERRFDRLAGQVAA